MNQFDDWLAEEDRRRRTTELHRELHHRSPKTNLLDLASNDYLGLSRDARVVAGAIHASETWGTGSTGSRLVTGSTELLRDLESELAVFMGYDTALVFSSGYLANLGAVTALGGPDCLIVSDELNHASLIDACRLSGAQVRVAPHQDPAAVAQILANKAQPRALVVTDAIFSVDGDLAPLAEIHQIARDSGAALLVDEAHSLGTVGQGGRGATVAAGIAGEPDVIVTATLSKSLGAQGGAVLATTSVRNHIINQARSFIFDTALVPAAAGAARVALQILREDSQLSEQTRVNAAKLRSILVENGWSAPVPEAAVVSAIAESPGSAVQATRVCREAGVHIGCFRPPSVPGQISRLRLTARANLNDSDFTQAAYALEQARKTLATTTGAAERMVSAESTSTDPTGRTT